MNHTLAQDLVLQSQELLPTYALLCPGEVVVAGFHAAPNQSQ